MLAHSKFNKVESSEMRGMCKKRQSKRNLTKMKQRMTRNKKTVKTTTDENKESSQQMQLC